MGVLSKGAHKGKLLGRGGLRGTVTHRAVESYQEFTFTSDSVGYSLGHALA